MLGVGGNSSPHSRRQSKFPSRGKKMEKTCFPIFFLRCWEIVCDYVPPHPIPGVSQSSLPGEKYGTEISCLSISYDLYEQIEKCTWMITSLKHPSGGDIAEASLGWWAGFMYLCCSGVAFSTTFIFGINGYTGRLNETAKRILRYAAWHDSSRLTV